MKQLKSILFLSFLSLQLFSQKVEVTKTGTFSEQLSEVSGMVQVGVDSFFVINDSGNKPEIYLVNTQGELLKRILVKGAKNNDWEDLALDQKGYLYLANVGNNNNKRKNLCIFKVKVSDVLNKDTVQTEKINFHYPEQKTFPPEEDQLYFDAEALWAMNDSLFILTKNRTSPFNGISYLYRLPAQKGNYTAEKIDEYLTCNNNMIKCWVTSADYHPKSKKIAVLTTKEIHILTYENGKLNREFVYTVPGMKQRESICFSQSESALYIADEVHKLLGGGNIYRLTWEK